MCIFPISPSVLGHHFFGYKILMSSCFPMTHCRWCSIVLLVLIVAGKNSTVNLIFIPLFIDNLPFLLIAFKICVYFLKFREGKSETPERVSSFAWCWISTFWQKQDIGNPVLGVCVCGRGDVFSLGCPMFPKPLSIIFTTCFHARGNVYLIGEVESRKDLGLQSPSLFLPSFSRILYGKVHFWEEALPCPCIETTWANIRNSACRWI